MPSNHLILCCPILLLPSIFPSIRVFSNESALHIRWPKYWSFSFNISPSNEHPGLISFRMDLLDLLAVQGTLKSLLQHHSSKASILQRSAFFIVQLSHPYMTTGKTIALTRPRNTTKHLYHLSHLLAFTDWRQEETGTTEHKMVRWHHQLNGHGFGWTPGVGDGQEGLVCYGSWGCKELDMTERLNWTELNWTWLSLDVELIAVSPVRYAFRFHSQHFHFPARVCIIINKRDTQEVPYF